MVLTMEAAEARDRLASPLVRDAVATLTVGDRSKASKADAVLSQLAEAMRMLPDAAVVLVELPPGDGFKATISVRLAEGMPVTEIARL